MTSSWTAASIVIGPLHSFPLNLKYQRLHLELVPSTLMFPWNETLSAELDCSLLNAQSWNKIKQIKHIVIRRATVYNTNYSCQDYFLMFKNNVIASFLLSLSIWPGIILSRRLVFLFLFSFFSFKKNQSRGKCNLVINVMFGQLWVRGETFIFEFSLI